MENRNFWRKRKRERKRQTETVGRQSLCVTGTFLLHLLIYYYFCIDLSADASTNLAAIDNGMPSDSTAMLAARDIRRCFDSFVEPSRYPMFSILVLAFASRVTIFSIRSLIKHNFWLVVFRKTCKWQIQPFSHFQQRKLRTVPTFCVHKLRLFIGDAGSVLICYYLFFAPIRI